MKEITVDEQKHILVDMLDYITKICIENNIKFTLAAGSLIGAIRHKGFIPWDDDIDIALVPEEYKKLKKILENKNGRYKLLVPLESPGYYYPFMKLVDTRTIVYETKIKKIPDYGVYVDIFQYIYLPNSLVARFFVFKKQEILKRLLGISVSNNQKKINKRNIIKKIVHVLINEKNTNYWLRKYLKSCRRAKSKYVTIIWHINNMKNDVQLVSNFKKYTLTDFEGKKTMITESYDEVLKTTFGNYMKLPPKDERVTHHTMKMYWRQDEEQNKK